ncbi:MAG: SusD/RagB family nutrient-binding outer membrane lipoprotein [Saprospiraceae bacterium]|nr:SusD/RagB family nutrient-binding outer membrane lipoprotein [Saprospiraceae bacterium]
MKIFNKSMFALLVAASMTTACNDFGDINISPNSPAQPSTSSLLTGALTNVGGVATAMVPCLYTQQFGDVTYIEESRYKTVNFDYAGFYTGPLNSLQTIIQLNTDAITKDAAASAGSNANQIATARILKAYFYLNMTDRWGDIPYSAALKGNENFTPAFDKQQDIYTDLFKELKEAQAQFDGGKTVSGDILLSGNTARWKKFANTLRAIMALRLSKVDATKGKAEFVAALADGAFTSNADNVQFKYLADANYEHPLYNNYITTNRKDFAVSDVMVNLLVKLNDPRLAAFADKATGTNTYRGVPYAVFPVTWKAQDVSLAATSMRAQNSAANVLTYAQLLFAQAEAAKLGWTSGNAKTLYEDAIKASMQQWGVYTDAAYASYIAQVDVVYSDAKALELIGTQRWIALFYQGYESWAEWRRTNYPALTPAAKPLNTSGKIPRRMAYPTSEPTLNKTNYDAVVARQGADVQETKVWWDK